MNTGTALGLQWCSSPTAALVAAPTLIMLLVTGRRQWQFHLSLLDDLPGTVACVGIGTTVIVSALVIIDYGKDARAALGVGALVLATTLLSKALAYDLLRRMRRRGWGLANAVIVGSGEAARQLANSMTSNRRYGVRLIGCIDDEEAVPPYHAPWLGPVQAMKKLIRDHRIDLLIVSPAVNTEDAIVTALREVGRCRCEVYVVPRLLGLEGRPRDGAVVGATPLVWIRRSPFHDASWHLKRCVDIGAAGLCLLLTLPVLVTIALAVRLELGRGVIFKQQRIGMDGKPFMLYKFRSLHPAPGEGDVVWSIDGDPRLGRVGTFIRSTKLDELPQLVNVLKGDMSLVGPRPERPYFVDQFNESISGYRQRHRVPVGLTGYAAVHGLCGDTSIVDRTRYDNFYADSWSLWLDVKIMLRTAVQLFRRSTPQPNHSPVPTKRLRIRRDATTANKFSTRTETAVARGSIADLSTPEPLP